MESFALIYNMFKRHLKENKPWLSMKIEVGFSFLFSSSHNIWNNLFAHFVFIICPFSSLMNSKEGIKPFLFKNKRERERERERRTAALILSHRGPEKRRGGSVWENRELCTFFFWTQRQGIKCCRSIYGSHISLNVHENNLPPY